MTAARKTKTTETAAQRADRIRRQRDWITDHGGNRAGYVLRYGPDGGAIYLADLARLRALDADR